MTRARVVAAVGAVGASLLLGLLAAGCGGGGGNAEEEAAQPEPLVTSVVGRLQGSDAFIVINSYRSGDVISYVCDGMTLGEVLRGSVTGGEIELLSESGAMVTGTLTTDAASGTVTTPDGKQFEFSARPPTGVGGAYRAVDKINGQEVKAGWVVLSNGEQRGLVRVAGSPSPAPTLDPSKPTVTVEGVGVIQVQKANPVGLVPTW